jgi:hypothetical protein
MKLRTDFVTNSSSSSFIIGTRDDDSDVEKALTKLFKMPEDHVLAHLGNTAIQVLLNRRFTEPFPNEDDLDDKDWSMEHKKTAWKLHELGWTLWQGSVSNEGEPEEGLLVDIGFEHMDGEHGVYIWKEEGF